MTTRNDSTMLPPVSTPDQAYRHRKLTQSYWPADTTRPLRDWTLGQLLSDTAARVPDRIALVAGHRDPAMRRQWTYAELNHACDRVARALLAHFEPGERVAMWANNVPEWQLLMYGAARAGVVLVTVNPACKLRELEASLRQAEVAGLFTMDSYRGHDCLSTARQAATALPAVRKVFRLTEFDAFLADGDDGRSLPPVHPDQACLMMFTSGTTGAQKGIVLHHKGLVNMSHLAHERGGLKDGGVLVNAMPMFHLGAMNSGGIGTVAHAATHVLAEEWESVLFMSLVQDFGGTYSLLVPTMVEALLNHPDRAQYNLATLRTLAAGAAKVEASTVRRARSEMGCDIAILFGQTEMHGVISAVHPDDRLEDKTDSLGQPMPQIEMKVADPVTGEVLPIGTVGEICIRGYQAMLGYYNQPEETAKAIRQDGWVHSGDLGTMDDRGFLKISGRLKEMIIRGGENIFPAEIETLLRDQPGVGAIAVVGVPDAYWGEQVAAVIIPGSGADRPDPDALWQLCRAELAAHKAPSLWYFADRFPTTETGKVQKFRLREKIVANELQAVPLQRSGKKTNDAGT